MKYLTKFANNLDVSHDTNILRSFLLLDHAEYFKERMTFAMAGDQRVIWGRSEIVPEVGTGPIVRERR
jgi:hypothetical protein